MPLRARTREGVVTVVNVGDARYVYPLVHRDHPDRTPSSWCCLAEVLDQQLRDRGETERFESSRRFGEYHPRMWRGSDSPSPVEANLEREWIDSVRASRSLYARLRDVFTHIEPETAHAGVYGHSLRELLLLACTEVESAWRAVLTANGFVAPAGVSYWKTADYVRLLNPMHLGEWCVQLSSHPDYGDIFPFKDWSASAPTQSLAWYDAYNAVKHDREHQLSKATLGHVVSAMSGLFVMIVAQFGTHHLERGMYLRSDEFRLIAEPRWSLEEMYVPSIRSPGGGWIDFDEWTAAACSI